MVKKIITLIGITTLVLCCCIYIMNDSHNVVIENKSLIKSGKTISLMLETGIKTGVYEASNDNSWPSQNYNFNEYLSKCENGGTIYWDDVKQKVVVKNNVSDKCYVYFDHKIPDIFVSTSNLAYMNSGINSTNCTGATANFNSLYNRMEISGLSANNIICSLSFSNRTSKTYLNNYIVSKSGQTVGNGKIVKENGYRYEGDNPNNYIWFNNELWRIIGVFDSSSHGLEGESLVKIIRDPIGAYAFNSSKFSDSAVKDLLNNAYYNSKVGDSCYLNKTLAINCDFTERGIKASYRKMIKNVKWFLGGVYYRYYCGEDDSADCYFKVSTDGFYSYERGDKVYTNYPTSIEEYIGLMYPSDYAYSALATSTCLRTNFSNVSNCSSWMFGYGNEWTIMPFYNTSQSSSILRILSTTRLSYETSGYNANNIRPTLYLDSSVFIVNGDGSASNPFQIGM